MLGKRGVSPLVATVLLVAITVIAAGLVYVWVSGYFGGLGKIGETPRGAIKIEDILSQHCGGERDIRLKHMGGDRLKLSDLRFIVEFGGARQTVQFNYDCYISPGATFWLCDTHGVVDNIVVTPVSPGDCSWTCLRTSWWSGAGLDQNWRGLWKVTIIHAPTNSVVAEASFNNA